MDSFFHIIKNKAPRYKEEYDDFVKKLSQFGGGKESDKYQEGRYFSNAYEVYIYAAFIGLYKNLKNPVTSAEKARKFWEIKHWKPQSLVDTLLSIIIADSEIELFILADSEEGEVEDSAYILSKRLEDYANGGLEYLKNKYEEDPNWFDNDDGILLQILMQ